jgi:Delta3-Delta2-enoyl-CoA isomerase
VQVGVPLPPVILSALRRQVGARKAERLAVAGLILSPEQSLSVGLVDELAPADEILERALAWCRNLLALPPEAMLATRRRARADLVTLFDQGSEEELRTVLDSWWSEETQEMRLGK